MNPFRRKSVPRWHGLIALLLFLTTPLWVVAFIGAIASAFGGNLLPVILFGFVAMWIISQL